MGWGAPPSTELSLFLSPLAALDGGLLFQPLGQRRWPSLVLRPRAPFLSLSNAKKLLR